MGRVPIEVKLHHIKWRQGLEHVTHRLRPLHISSHWQAKVWVQDLSVGRGVAPAPENAAAGREVEAHAEQDWNPAPTDELRIHPLGQKLVDRRGNA